MSPVLVYLGFAVFWISLGLLLAAVAEGDITLPDPRRRGL